MFARASATLVLALPLLVAASAVPRTDGPSNQCNTGTIQCCNTVDTTTASGGLLAGLLGVVLGPLTALIGLNCSPLSIIGIAGNSCTAQPVCCTGNQFNGLISVGCTPINLNL